MIKFKNNNFLQSTLLKSNLSFFIFINKYKDKNQIKRSIAFQYFF